MDRERRFSACRSGVNGIRQHRNNQWNTDHPRQLQLHAAWNRQQRVSAIRGSDLQRHDHRTNQLAVHSRNRPGNGRNALHGNLRSIGWSRTIPLVDQSGIAAGRTPP